MAIHPKSSLNISTMLHILSKQPSIANRFISELRDHEIQTDRMRFRLNLERLGEVFAYEISKLMRYDYHEVETPLGVARTSLSETQPVIASVLRAGLPLQSGMIRFFDKADTAFVGTYRNIKKSGNFELHTDYQTTPGLDGRTLIITDALLATGRTMVMVAKQLIQEQELYQLHLVSALASEEGLTHVRAHLPKAHIWVGDVDQELTSKLYLVPGLGDAGDLAYGPKT